MASWQQTLLAFLVNVHNMSEKRALATRSAGLDALIFTAGIGKNSEAVRQAVWQSFAYLAM